MKNINYQHITSDNINFLADLCNKLMKFQADHAVIHPEIMASMNYNNRLKPEYASTAVKTLIVAYDENQPIGFAFAAVNEVNNMNLASVPDWASDLTGNGFYPIGYPVPRTIGTFKILYLEEAYRGQGIGKKLSDMTMNWLEQQKNVEDLWVYVANGNESVGSLYEMYGFHLSHAVYNGFILAYCLNKK